MKVLACYSMKGGVGKTATAVNVAWLAAHAGLKTLLIDLDPQAAASYYYQVKPAKKDWSERFFKAYEHLLEHIKHSQYERLDVIPATLGFREFDVLLENIGKRKQRLAMILAGLKDDYDLVILDCPPTLGNLAESIFTAADHILTPVIPTTLSERTFDHLIHFFEEHDYPKKKLMPFFSLVQVQKSLHHHTMDTLRQRSDRFLQTTIPFASDIEKMGEHQQPVVVSAPRSKGGLAYAALWDEIAPVLQPAAQQLD